MSYFPTLVEVGVSVGIVAGAGLLFIFFVEKLRVYPEEHWEETASEPSDFFDPHTMRVAAARIPWRRPGDIPWRSWWAAAATIAFLPEGALWEDENWRALRSRGRASSKASCRSGRGPTGSSVWR